MKRPEPLQILGVVLFVAGVVLAVLLAAGACAPRLSMCEAQFNDGQITQIPC